MSILEWAIIGLLGLVMLVLSARVMRRGVRTLDENRKEWQEHIQQTEREIEKDRKNISSSDQLQLLKAAMLDLLRLNGCTTDCKVEENDGVLLLISPAGEWRVELIMKESSLRSSKRVLHGQARWRLEALGHEELHMDPASLMRSLNEHLKNAQIPETRELDSHIRRRMSHLPQEPGYRRR